MRATILREVSTLEETMWGLYEELMIIHEAIFRLDGLQQQSKEICKTLRNVQNTITVMQEWKM